MAKRRLRTTALERVFRKRTLMDYYEAGRELETLVATEGGGRPTRLIKDLTGKLDARERILWAILRFYRTFTEKTVAEAEAMGAEWSEVRRFMEEPGKREVGDLTALRRRVEERRNRARG